MNTSFVAQMLPTILLFVRTATGSTILLLALSFIAPCQAELKDDSTSAKKWVGTWSTAPQLVETGNNPPAPGLSNNTLRQIVRASIGGDSLRMRFSNEFSSSAVTFHEVHIAVSKGGGAIDSIRDKVLAFSGQAEVTLAPGTAITSDPVAFDLQPRMDLAITIYYGNTSATVTGHPGSRTTSYLMTGNEVSRADFAGAVTTDHWYNINSIEVLAAPSAASVAILGNSITDGRGSTTNMQNRWPDIFSESLLKDSSTQHVGVLNMGIGGNAVLSGGLGPTGVSRFDRDILNQAGVRWAIVFEGVNDIGGVRSAAAATTIASGLIAAYQQMIVKAHAKSIRIYGATILPFNGNGYYNQYSEQCRSTVNAWIRGSGNFDACIDFDQLMRNPQDTTRLGCATYQNDGLHPDAAAYRTMGESIDRSLFVGTEPTLGVNSREMFEGYMLGQNYPNPFNPTTTIRFTTGRAVAPSGSEGPATKARLVVYDLLGRTIATLLGGEMRTGRHEVTFDGSGLSSGVYVYRFTAGKYVESRKMILLR
jgi:lysophospholipase L1-like esterase